MTSVSARGIGASELVAQEESSGAPDEDEFERVFGELEQTVERCEDVQENLTTCVHPLARLIARLEDFPVVLSLRASVRGTRKRAALLLARIYFDLDSDEQAASIYRLLWDLGELDPANIELMKPDLRAFVYGQRAKESEKRRMKEPKSVCDRRCVDFIDGFLVRENARLRPGQYRLMSVNLENERVEHRAIWISENRQRNENKKLEDPSARGARSGRLETSKRKKSEGALAFKPNHFKRGKKGVVSSVPKALRVSPEAARKRLRWGIGIAGAGAGGFVLSAVAFQDMLFTRPIDTSGSPVAAGLSAQNDGVGAFAMLTSLGLVATGSFM